MAVTRVTLLEGTALGCFTGFWFLARDSDPDAIASCVVCAVVVFMLWMFIRIVMTKASPAYNQPKSTPPASDQILSTIASRRSIFPKDLNGRIINKETLAKFELMDLTIELCRTNLPSGTAEKTVEKLQKKRDSTSDKISHYIAVCMKRSAKPDTIPEWEEMCAVAAAAQNMLLAATGLGVAGYWTSWQAVARDSAEMKKFLGLDEADRCLGFLVLGYSDVAEQYRGSRRSAASEKTTWKL